MELIAQVFGYLLKFLFSICGNYGWAIVLFSLAIKVILFPLIMKQQKSLRKTQELQPKLAEIQERYADDQEKLALEYQKFMTDNKYNPFSGCLISILQIFIILGIFYVVRSPMKYMDKLSSEEIDSRLRTHIAMENMLNNSGDMLVVTGEQDSGNTVLVKVSGDTNKELYGKTLVKVDFSASKSGDKKEISDEELEEYKKKNRFYELYLLRDEYKERLDFLGIDLSTVTSQDWGNFKLWIIPILTVITYYISLYMISKMQNATKQKIKDPDGNEIEMPNMMAMNFTMPLLSGWIALSTPQGMGLYWFASSIFQIISQMITKRMFPITPVENDDSEIVPKKYPNANANVIEVNEVEEEEYNDSEEVEEPAEDVISKPNNNSKKKKNKKNKRK